MRLCFKGQVPVSKFGRTLLCQSLFALPHRCDSGGLTAQPWESVSRERRAERGLSTYLLIFQLNAEDSSLKTK